MRSWLLIALLLSFGTAQAEEYAEQIPQHFLKVTIPDREAFEFLMQSGLDIPEQMPGSVMDVIATSADVEWLEARGYGVEYEIRDLSRHFAQLGAGAASMAGFRTLSEVESAVDSLITDFPAIVSAKITIGTTSEGRPIHAIRISDNPNIDEGEPAVLINAAHHAREVITPQIVVYTMQQLAYGYGTDTLLTRLVNEREIWFIPVVNPDGYYYNEATNPGGFGVWRKNRRVNGDGTFGVDLNRNYGMEWGHDDFGSSPFTGEETYRGPSAFSEPETQALRDFCIAHPNIRIAFNYHSYSNLLLYPWGYFQGYAQDNAIFEAIADSATSFNNYFATPGWGLYLTNGGSDDWMYGEQGILSFTPEVGSGSDWFWPSQSRIEPLILENYPANIFIIDVADGPERLLPPLASQWDSVFALGGDSLELTWSNPDTSSNAPVMYHVVEYSGPQRIADDLESGADNWDLQGSSIAGNVGNSGSSSIYSETGDGFSSLTTATQPYFVEAGDTLRFWALYNIETDFDYAYVEVSTDAGQNWTSIAGNLTTDTDPNGGNLGHGITGVSGGWVEAWCELAAYEGAEILVRYAYRTDQFTSGFGIYIDDIFPVQIFESTAIVATTPTPSAILNGYPAGDYFFRVVGTDAHGQTSESLTLSFGYTPAYMAGDVDASGVINSADLIFLVNFVFKSGPGPLPVAEAGDADASGVINSGDLVYMVNYIFKSGPPPVQP